MKNKYKKVYSLAHEAGFRNYTVKDLIDLKGLNCFENKETIEERKAIKYSKIVFIDYYENFR